MPEHLATYGGNCAGQPLEIHLANTHAVLQPALQLQQQANLADLPPAIDNHIGGHVTLAKLNQPGEFLSASTKQWTGGAECAVGVNDHLLQQVACEAQADVDQFALWGSR